MDLLEYIRLCLVKRGNMSLRELAAKMETTPQNLSNKLRINNLKHSEIEKIAKALDAHLEIRFVDNETNQPII